MRVTDRYVIKHKIFRSEICAYMYARARTHTHTRTRGLPRAKILTNVAGFLQLRVVCRLHADGLPQAGVLELGLPVPSGTPRPISPPHSVFLPCVHSRLEQTTTFLVRSIPKPPKESHASTCHHDTQ
jgi:hypothetical protein